MSRHNGDKFNVFVKAGGSAPGTPGAPASYTKVGQRTSSGLDGTSQETEIRDADGTAVDYSTPKYTGTISVNYDPTGDDGVAILRDAFRDRTEVYVLMASPDAGEEFKHFPARVGGFRESFPVGQPATAEFTFGLTSAPTYGENA